MCRISPLLNAVDMDQYPCNTAAPPPRPTTVMLSHVYPLKDILTAIRAAAVIVQTYHVAGATRRARRPRPIGRGSLGPCHDIRMHCRAARWRCTPGALLF